MYKIFKILIPFLSVFTAFMLFCMLYRMANGKTPFISIRVLLKYISTIDMEKPLWEFINTFKRLYNSFVQVGYVPSSGDEWTKLFIVLSNFFTAIWNAMKFPLDLLLSILKFIYNIILYVNGFISAILNA